MGILAKKYSLNGAVLRPIGIAESSGHLDGNHAARLPLYWLWGGTPEWLCGIENVTSASIDVVVRKRNGWNQAANLFVKKTLKRLLQSYRWTVSIFKYHSIRPTDYLWVYSTNKHGVTLPGSTFQDLFWNILHMDGLQIARFLNPTTLS